MHNGSLRTVRDVLVFYEALSDAVSETLDGGDTTTQPRLDPLLKHLNLNADDFPALEAFLDSLNADEYGQSSEPIARPELNFRSCPRRSRILRLEFNDCV